jgi:16S rRNA (cytidine1402-2'-O)-methyltransferase
VGTLYIIGTPIGNLGDLTFRAVEVLKSLDILACEDTRRTLKLLNHLAVPVPLVSCRSGNEEQAARRVLRVLAEGKNAGYTSDAGTPALSDPGGLLTRRAAGAGHQVLPVPGPSAFTSLVSVAGSLDKQALFEGFLSPKAGRRRARLQELLALGTAFVLYESPRRILKLMGDLAELDGARYVCIGREMTKIHEEYLRGPAREVLGLLETRDAQMGEFSVYVASKKID